MDTLRAYWEKIPAPIRTMFNVAAAALLTWFVTDGIAGLDLSPAILAVLTAVGTAIVRALNPVDSVYGVGSDPGEL